MRRILVCLLVLAACSDDDGGPVSIDDLGGAVTSAYCNLYVKCGLVDDVSLCQTLNLDIEADADTIAAVKAGLITYDADQAAICLGAISSASCERNHMKYNTEACDLTFHGTVPAGGECAMGAECISGDCDVPSCPDACCKGTCLDGVEPARPHVGEACGTATTGQCIDSFCDSTTLVCTAYLALGQPCQSTSQCATGTCNGTCTATPGPGDPCGDTSTTRCAEIGDYCSPTSMTCVAYGLAGAPCSDTQTCSPVYVCDPSGKCVLGPRLGESCSDTQRCIDISYCSPTTSMCTAPQADGASCQSDSECAGDCDAATNTCVTPPICF